VEFTIKTILLQGFIQGGGRGRGGTATPVYPSIVREVLGKSRKHSRVRVRAPNREWIFHCFFSLALK